jgi:AraC-like DNA-binding protein
LQELAQAAGLSQWHFLRQFKKYVGMTPHLWLVQHRILKAKRLLRAGEPLVNIAMQCGFADQSHFTRHFKKALGVTPQNYRQQLILN